MASTSGSFSMEESRPIDVPPHFNGTNYRHWKRCMMIFIKAFDMEAWMIIKKGYSSPTKKAKKWRVSSCSSAKKMWDKLEDIYRDKEEEGPIKVMSLLALTEPNVSSNSNISNSKSFNELQNAYDNNHNNNTKALMDQQVKEGKRIVSPKLFTTLSNKEKEQDFMAMKGCKLPQRPKKRAKLIQRSILVIGEPRDMAIRPVQERQVREKKTSKKKPRGLKAMGSDSERLIHTIPKGMNE
ncbi:hypothetical protein F3Y22_tig00000340pilonHSYRG00471 [Hibiscus syriacus]|uniref:DUF4219 domain-containing protein n=1 Tax=Hibiscus syriacus TaxID=106335 RepID=A0A6A3D4L6_HIBSY|nr:hypothetical protein F3Y22_tig00000340pilonHSYRG00471 [Hibiscus syriacus]